MQARSKPNLKIYIWDNGEDFLHHSIWFIETDLDQDVVEAILEAAIDPKLPRGGVIAVIDSDRVTWHQSRVETLANWFTCHGDELVDWRHRAVHSSLRRLPLPVARDLSYRLYPSNAEIVAESLGFDLD